jgi:3-hydroxybutyryl-CoA dehydrogenase
METMTSIGVIGSGVMGVDVAINCAAYGYRVVLMDQSAEVIAKAQLDIPKKLRNYKMLSAAYRELDASQLSSLIEFTTDIDSLRDCRWVIENVTEDWDVKASVYKQLDQICSDRTYYAVNTSCISITKVAALMQHPEKVIGMHFMNPVPIKRCVEAIRGFHTSDDTIDAAKEFLKSLKKRMILVNDMPGFVANRLSHLFMNEAAFLVQDNVADAVAIDSIFKEGYGHAMGPLETADLIGLDTVVNSLKILYESFQDPKFRCCPSLQKMVDAGLLGRKSGQGFYSY